TCSTATRPSPWIDGPSLRPRGQDTRRVELSYVSLRARGRPRPAAPRPPARAERGPCGQSFRKAACGVLPPPPSSARGRTERHRRPCRRESDLSFTHEPHVTAPRRDAW